MADLNPPLRSSLHRSKDRPARSPHHKSPRKRKPGLTRASSSLAIAPGLEPFPSLMGRLSVEEHQETKASENVETANATNTSPVRRLNDGHLISKSQDPFGPDDNAVAPEMSSDGFEKNNDGFASTFYGSIHGTYHNFLRELDHWFGEIKPRGLSSKTMREVAQCELLHLLAITTDNPDTYQGCIRKAYEICRAMGDCDIAANLLKKTHHLDMELHDEFAAKDNTSAVHHPGRIKPLDTIAEEDNDQSSLVDESLSASTNAGTPSPSKRNQSEKLAASVLVRPEANEPTKLTEEHLAKLAYNEYVHVLEADAMRRQEATDRYIASLEEDVALRKKATDQYLAGLEATMSSQH